MYLSGVIAIVALFLPSGESQVLLERTTPTGMQSVCPNATVVFTCRVTGSSFIGWTSTDYVGPNQVSFTIASMNGSNMTVINDGVAILTQNSGGILESQLHIHASVNASIRCVPTDVADGVTVSLTVYNDFPGMPTDAAAFEILSRDEICVILVEWDHPTDTPREDISDYIIRDSINGFHKETRTTFTLATFPLSQCTNSLNISITTVDRCGREGPSVDVQPALLPQMNPVTDTTTAGGTLSGSTTTISTPNASGTSQATMAALIGVIILLVLLAIIGTAASVTLFCYRQRTKALYARIVQRDDEKLECEVTVDGRVITDNVNCMWRELPVQRGDAEQQVGDNSALLPPQENIYESDRKYQCHVTYQRAKWCMTTNVTSNVFTVKKKYTDGGMLKVFIPPDNVWPWKGYEKIYINFLNADLLTKSGWTIGDGRPMNIDTILQYANTWNDIGGEEIPRFVEARDGQEAQIRVNFNNNKIRNSHWGKSAQSVLAPTPTMNLDLHNGCPSNEFKKYLIIHEFGHTLGLGYEHQHSSFWKFIKPFTDTKKMKRDLGVTEEEFSIAWKEIDNSETGHHMEEYDPDSIMHFRFKVEWLTEGYSDKAKIERDLDSGKLSTEDAKVLLSVHKRRWDPPTEPSDLDIQLLEQLYDDESVDTEDSGENNTDANTDSEVELTAYADPNSIEHQQAPGGEEYPMVDMSAFYQDPYKIQHQEAAGGDLYAVTEKPRKSSKKTKEPSEDQLAQMYSVPEKSRKNQAGLTYADIDLPRGGAIPSYQLTEYTTLFN